MKNLIRLTFNTKFESDSQRTPQYLAWHRIFKIAFTNYLAGLGINNVKVAKPNHFDALGFFQLENNQVFYFNLSDLRGSKDTLLVRKAQSFLDYQGGFNKFVSFTNYEDFDSQFRQVIGIN